MQPLLAASAAPPASHDISAEQSQTQGSGDDSSRGPEEPVDRFAHRSRPWRRRGAPPSLTASASAPSLAATEAAPTPVDVLASTIGGAAAVPQLLTITADAIAAEAPRAALRALPPDAEEVAAAEDAARASVSLGLPLRLAEHRRKFLLGAMLESRYVALCSNHVRVRLTLSYGMAGVWTCSSPTSAKSCANVPTVCGPKTCSLKCGISNRSVVASRSEPRVRPSLTFTGGAWAEA